MEILVISLFGLGGLVLGRVVSALTSIVPDEKTLPAPAGPAPSSSRAQRESRMEPTTEEKALIGKVRDNPALSSYFAKTLLRPVVLLRVDEPDRYDAEITRMAVLMQKGLFTVEDAYNFDFVAGEDLSEKIDSLGIG